MRYRWLMLVVVLMPCAGCGQQSAPEHVPGRPVVFPVDAESYLLNLARSVQVNCKAEDATVEAACIARIERRSVSCFKEPLIPYPSVLDDREHSKRVSRRYLDCVMPHPICHGMEVKSSEDKSRLCRSSS